MRMRVVVLLVVLLGGCHGSSAPSETVLTLFPVAMRLTGPTAGNAGDARAICLSAGASAEANVHVSRSAVTIIVIAFTPAAAPIPSFELELDSHLVAMDSIRSVSPEAMVYTAHPERGEHVLRIRVPGESPGVLCLQQLTLTQR